MTTTTTPYGMRVPSSYHPTSVVGEVTTAPAGNVVLRIGRAEVVGWTATEHVVMTPNEAEEFALEVLAAAGWNAESIESAVWHHGGYQGRSGHDAMQHDDCAECGTSWGGVE